MRGKTAFIGFLILELAMLALWIGSLAPVLGADTPLLSDAQQIWSGGAFSNTTGSFRGDQGVLAAKFEPTGNMLWATLLIAASGVVAWFAGGAFRRDRSWLSAALSMVALGLAAGGAYYAITQWSGDTAFEPPAINVMVLYMATRAAVIQLFVGWILLAIFSVLAIAGIANAGKPLGYHLVVLNWTIVAVVWVAVFVGLYALPGLLGS
jgi:heme/copper-type cytochrome/quinol oxidase subunit 3